VKTAAKNTEYCKGIHSFRQNEKGKAFRYLVGLFDLYNEEKEFSVMAGWHGERDWDWI